VELNEMVARIVEEKGIDERDVKEKIKSKQKELGGLITPEGAAHVVANELGMNLFEGVSKEHMLKIENVIPGMSKVDLCGKVLRIYETREFEKKDGSAGRVASLTLGDDTGRIRTVFWDDDVALIEEEKISEGDIIKIKEAYSRETINGEAEVHIGRRSRVTINPKGVEIVAEGDMNRSLEALEEGMSSVDVVGRILRIYQPREFERDDGTKGRVANLVIGDSTGRARLVFWDDDVALVEGKEIAVGDALKVKRGYVRMRYGEPEVNVGRYGKVVLNPPEAKVLPEVEDFDVGFSKKEIPKFEEGDEVEVRGAIVDLYESNPIYEKEGSSGIVLNAILDDGFGNIRMVFFNRLAELVLNASTSEVIEAEDAIEFVRTAKRDLVGKEITVTGTVKYNKTYDRFELVAQDLDLNPDPKREFNVLLKNVKKMVGE